MLLQMLDEAPMCLKESSSQGLVHREGSETMPRCLEDPDFLQEVLQQLPKPLYWAANSDLAVGVLRELADVATELRKSPALTFKRLSRVSGVRHCGYGVRVLEAIRLAWMDSRPESWLFFSGRRRMGRIVTFRPQLARTATPVAPCLQAC